MTADSGGMVDGEMEAEEALQTSDGASAPPTKRKRQNLTHLTEEERVMRRKLKNRMAAQSARDRKKAHMDDLEKLVLRLEKQNAALMKENQSLRASLNNGSNIGAKISKPTDSSRPSSKKTSLTRESLDRISSASSSESAAFGSVLLQKERTAAWVRRQLLLRLSTATRCFTCLVALMLTSSLRSRMLSSTDAKKSPLTPQEKRLLMRLHLTNQSMGSCSHQRYRHSAGCDSRSSATWWGPQQRNWNPARIAEAEA